MKLLTAVMIATLLPTCLSADGSGEQSFLKNPPVFTGSLPDMPLPLFGAVLPPPGKALPGVDFASMRSSGWKSSGAPVQPALGVTLTTISIGGLYGLSQNWAAGLSIPFKQNQVRGGIGGQNATRNVLGLSNIALLGKRLVWQGSETDQAAVTFGVEIPTGTNRAKFDQANPSTTAYFGAPVMPVSWQPSSGSWNGYLAAAYRGSRGRVSYSALLAAKLHTAGYQDSTNGNIMVLSANTTYGVAKNLAVALGLMLRVQGNDSYPNAPPPGVGQPALAGTTTHSSWLTIDPSVRFRLAGFVVGAGFRPLIVRPDSGIVPDSNVYLIFYPGTQVSQSN